jgi:hypothetical protein
LDDLHAAIAPFVVSPGWFLYQEKANDQVKPDLLVAHKHFISSMSCVCGNLSFSQAQLVHVFKKLFVELGFEEMLTEHEAKDWVDSTVRRVRVAFRHVSQARVRPVPPRWLAHIDGAMSQLPDAGSSHGRAAEEEEEEEQEEEEESLPEDPELVAQDALRQESEDLTCTVDNNTCSAMI